MLVNEYQAPQLATRSRARAAGQHARQGEEPQPVLGLPVRDHGPHARRDIAPKRVLGFPVNSLGPEPAGREQLLSLVHPIRTYKRWARRRRLGPYATDQDE